MFDWVRNPGPKPKPESPGKPAKRYGWELKKLAVEEVANGQDIRSVADQLGVVNYATVHEWIRKWRTEGDVGLMGKREQIEAGAYKTRAQLEAALPDGVDELKRLAARLTTEKAVLERELELAKKSPGGIPGKLPNKSKAKIADELKGKLPLALLLEVLELPPSSHCYAAAAAKRPDAYAEVRPPIHEIAAGSGNAYGSPRIWLALRGRGVFISEKVVRRLMKEERVEVRYAKRKRKYPSYAGEITPAVDNLAKGDFHAERPDELWLTDITGFAAIDGKVYLSPMIDCHDGMVASWSTSRHPDSDLASKTLEGSVGTLDAAKRASLKQGDGRDSLVMHTDRGGHYRGGAWIERLEGLGIARSMSRKGNSGDNAACEGFFGRMKTEMHYGIKWRKASDLESAIDAYIDFYNNGRITSKLGGMTIAEHRDTLTKVSKKAS
ncbi:IS3 family transposase [Gordonibacter sp. Marseille-P4307]|uniref:IS3 family transposase n=1 Tax=Gordonibacter sp. Marseille-P4307 TaxID=2161815 RepID=UPI0013DE6D41|nr:IS3 family transposase [Gordonibacter sp. Marseille-P4307]